MSWPGPVPAWTEGPPETPFVNTSAANSTRGCPAGVCNHVLTSKAQHRNNQRTEHVSTQACTKHRHHNIHIHRYRHRYIHSYIHTYTYMHTHLHTHSHTSKHIHVYTHSHTQKHKNTYTYKYIDTRSSPFIHRSTHSYSFTYNKTNIDTPIQTHTTPQHPCITTCIPCTQCIATTNTHALTCRKGERNESALKQLMQGV